MLWLAAGPRSVGSLVLDVNTLVYAAAALICGFQAVAFALFAKVFAINARLLPPDRRIERMTRLLSMEVGIVMGGLLLVAGLAASAYAVGFWGRAAFGPLDPAVSLRIVVPAVTALVLGLQTVFSSFFLSVLGLKTK